jgi:hypothetical protein
MNSGIIGKGKVVVIGSDTTNVKLIEIRKGGSGASILLALSGLLFFLCAIILAIETSVCPGCKKTCFVIRRGSKPHGMCRLCRAKTSPEETITSVD